MKNGGYQLILFPTFPTLRYQVFSLSIYHWYMRNRENLKEWKEKGARGTDNSNHNAK
jgi:hypothetical protein